MRATRLAAGLISAVLTVIILGSCMKKEAAVYDNGRVKLSWWASMHGTASRIASNYGELEFYKKLQERTGVEIEFIHPPEGKETESLNLMIASGKHTDLISQSTKHRDRDGVFLDLTSLIKKSAPNLMKVLSENENYRKAVTEDDGTFDHFPLLSDDAFLICWYGPQIRKDWLDELGLPLPETIDEWENTLRVFKARGVEFPLTLSMEDPFAGSAIFKGAYEIGGRFYEVDGVMHCAYLEEEYKDYLMLLNRWYKEGLLDPDFYTQENKMVDAKILGGRAGAWAGGGGGKLGIFLSEFQKSNPDAVISGTKYPVLEKGTQPVFGRLGHIVSTKVLITNKCENPESAVGFLDYGYGEEGHMFWNFGEEGVSYNLVDGYPKYTDTILENENGWDMPTAMFNYMASSYGGPFVHDKRYYEQYLRWPQQREAAALWSDVKYYISPNLSFTNNEAAKLSSLESAINTYNNEWSIKFIVGEADFSVYEQFVDNIRQMGCDELLQIYQDALTRYNNR